MPRYRAVQADGIVFLFAYDIDDPELLHIYARHLMSPDDVLRVWFDENAEEIWNEERQRSELRTKTHVLYWKWLGDRVLVISCFTRED